MKDSEGYYAVEQWAMAEVLDILAAMQSKAGGDENTAACARMIAERLSYGMNVGGV